MTGRTASRIAWAVVAVGAVAAVWASWLVDRAGVPTVGASPAGGVVGAALLLVMGLSVLLLVGGTGALIVGRFPRNGVGWTFTAFTLVAALTIAAYGYGYAGLIARPGSLPAARLVELLGEVLWLPLIALQIVALPVLFPEGRLASSARRRIFAWGMAGAGSAALGSMLAPRLVLVDVENPLAARPSAVSTVLIVVGFVSVLGASLAAGVSLIRRFRRSTGALRQQMKWFVYTAATVVAVQITLQFVGTWETWVQLLMAAAIAMLPVAVGIGILKYRLFDIDLVVSKAFLYGSLAAFIGLVYVAVVVGVGTLIGSRGSPTLSAVAAAVVALAFQPVRRGAERVANRIVYGERTSPYEVLTGFAHRLADTYSVEDVLPRMARTIAESTGAARVAIRLSTASGLRPVVSWPADPSSPGDGEPARGERSFEVRHQGEVLGTIAIAMPPNEPLTGAHERLVGGLAAQAGLVLRNVRLLEDVRASRRRLVASQDQERRRIERNIHDGAQQQLVALQVKQRLVDSMIDRDPEQAHVLMEQLQRDTSSALEDLRDLARGIYPPLLADQGLGAALESQARKSAVPVRVETDGIGRYPPEAEAAVYFSCLEALQNVAKYAEAGGATVRLSHTDGVLAFEVSDDGRGFDPAAARHGSGLQGMADRLAALGGELRLRSSPGEGTTIRGRLPVEAAR